MKNQFRRYRQLSKDGNEVLKNLKNQSNPSLLVNNEEMQGNQVILPQIVQNSQLNPISDNEESVGNISYRQSNPLQSQKHLGTEVPANQYQTYVQEMWAIQNDRIGSNNSAFNSLKSRLLDQKLHNSFQEINFSKKEVIALKKIARMNQQAFLKEKAPPGSWSRQERVEPAQKQNPKNGNSQQTKTSAEIYDRNIIKTLHRKRRMQNGSQEAKEGGQAASKLQKRVQSSAHFRKNGRLSTPYNNVNQSINEFKIPYQIYDSLSYNISPQQKAGSKLQNRTVTQFFPQPQRSKMKVKTRQQSRDRNRESLQSLKTFGLATPSKEVKLKSSSINKSKQFRLNVKEFSSDVEAENNQALPQERKSVHQQKRKSKNELAKEGNDSADKRKSKSINRFTLAIETKLKQSLTIGSPHSPSKKLEQLKARMQEMTKDTVDFKQQSCKLIDESKVFQKKIDTLKIQTAQAQSDKIELMRDLATYEVNFAQECDGEIFERVRAIKEKVSGCRAEMQRINLKNNLEGEHKWMDEQLKTKINGQLLELERIRTESQRLEKLEGDEKKLKETLQMRLAKMIKSGQEELKYQEKLFHQFMAISGVQSFLQWRLSQNGNFLVSVSTSLSDKNYKYEVKSKNSKQIQVDIERELWKFYFDLNYEKGNGKLELKKWEDKEDEVVNFIINMKGEGLHNGLANIVFTQLNNDMYKISTRIPKCPDPIELTIQGKNKTPRELASEIAEKLVIYQTEEGIYRLQLLEVAKGTHLLEGEILEAYKSSFSLRSLYSNEPPGESKQEGASILVKDLEEGEEELKEGEGEREVEVEVEVEGEDKGEGEGEEKEKEVDEENKTQKENLNSSMKEEDEEEDEEEEDKEEHESESEESSSEGEMSEELMELMKDIKVGQGGVRFQSILLQPRQRSFLVPSDLKEPQATQRKLETPNGGDLEFAIKSKSKSRSKSFWKFTSGKSHSMKSIPKKKQLKKKASVLSPEDQQLLDYEFFYVYRWREENKDYRQATKKKVRQRMEEKKLMEEENKRLELILQEEEGNEIVIHYTQQLPKWDNGSAFGSFFMSTARRMQQDFGHEHLIGASEIPIPNTSEKMKLLFYSVDKADEIVCNINIVHNLDQSKQLSLYYQASESKSMEKSCTIDKKESMISHILAGMDKQGNIAANFTNQMMLIITRAFLNKMGIPLYKEIGDVIRRINDFAALPSFKTIVLGNYFRRLDLIKNSLEGKRPTRLIESQKNVLLASTNVLQENNKLAQISQGLLKNSTLMEESSLVSGSDQVSASQTGSISHTFFNK